MLKIEKKPRTLFGLSFLVVLLFSANPSLAQKMSILIYPFENTGSKEYSWISAGMTDTVISDLAIIRDIRVIFDADRKKALKEMEFILSGIVAEEAMIKVGKVTGANVILSGSYLVIGGRIRVNVRLINVETGNVERMAKIDGTLSELFELQDRVVIGLLEDTSKISFPGVARKTITQTEKRVIQERSKPTLKAYEFYAKGLELENTDPKEALRSFEKAIEIDQDYLDALIAAGMIKGSILSLFDDGLGYLKRAKAILLTRKERDTADYANLMMNIGVVFYTRGDMDWALKYYRDSQGTRDRLGLQNTANYATLMMNLGVVYGDRGELNSALKCYVNSQVVLDGLWLQNTAQYADLMLNLGLIFYWRGEQDNAIKHFLTSQAIRDRLGLQNTADYATLMMNLGVVYRDRGELNSALKCYTVSQTVIDRLKLQNTSKYATLMMDFGVVHRDSGELKIALEYYVNSEAILDRLGLQNTPKYADLMGNIGIICYEVGEIDTAIEYFLTSQATRDRLGLQNTVDYARLAFNMAVLYEKKRNIPLAGQYYREAYNAFYRAGYEGHDKNTALQNAQRLGY